MLHLHWSPPTPFFCWLPPATTPPRIQSRKKKHPPSHFLNDINLPLGSVAADVIGSAVEEDEPLMAAGMDSLSSVEFRNRLTAEAGAGIKFPYLGWETDDFVGGVERGMTRNWYIYKCFIIFDIYLCINIIYIYMLYTVYIYIYFIKLSRIGKMETQLRFLSFTGDFQLFLFFLATFPFLTRDAHLAGSKEYLDVRSSHSACHHWPCNLDNVGCCRVE